MAFVLPKLLSNYLPQENAPATSGIYRRGAYRVNQVGTFPTFMDLMSEGNFV